MWLIYPNSFIPWICLLVWKKIALKISRLLKCVSQYDSHDAGQMYQMNGWRRKNIRQRPIDELSLKWDICFRLYWQEIYEWIELRINALITNIRIFSYFVAAPPPQCVQKTPATGGSPCSSGYIKWFPIKNLAYVSGHNIVTTAALTEEQCKDLCWSTAACKSADWTTTTPSATTATCYINNDDSPTVTTDKNENLLTFQCCEAPPGQWLVVTFNRITNSYENHLTEETWGQRCKFQ
jgi:hypothetical protein